MKKLFQSHPYHLVNPSPWPICTSASLFSLVLSGVFSMHGFENMSIIFYLAFIMIIYSMSLWFRDIISEATYLGNHTNAVRRGLNLGFGLFIVSEALFFLAIFWAFFHSSLAPSIELGAKWPPMGIAGINPFEVPLLNTILLLASGVTLTHSHHSLISGDRKVAIYGLIKTVILAVIFTIFQGVEYKVSSFSISDGSYGSTFFFGTGFHGLHVIIGTLFLLVGLWRLTVYHLTDHHHLGYESSILYWHFVDIVWLVLFLSFYVWGY